MKHSEYLKKVLVLFVVLSFSLALIISLFANWKVGLIFGGLFGLFMSVHLGRTLIAESFEITPSNKDKMKGLSWYEDEIIAHMKDLRYQLIKNEQDTKIWAPPVRAQLMGGNFTMKRTPYSITIEGPRGTVRIMKSILDLNKIFL